MKYIIRNALIGPHLNDETFKTALLEEVQSYMNTYFSQESISVHGEWQEADLGEDCYKNEKVDGWVKILLSKF